MVDKSVLDIVAGKYKNNTEILIDIFLSIFFIGNKYYAEIRELTIPLVGNVMLVTKRIFYLFDVSLTSTTPSSWSAQNRMF